MQISPAPASVSYRPLRVVAVGDSLTAGTMDSTTVESGQQMSYMAQLSRRVGFPFQMATISESGIGPAVFENGTFNYGHARDRDLAIRQATAPLEAELAQGQIPRDLTAVWNIPGMGHRTESSQDAPFHRQSNFAVPGYEARHVAGVRHYDEYLMEMRDGVEPGGLAGEVPLIRNLLQNGTDRPRGSALDQAISRNPDLTVVWAGNNDALETVGHGRIDDRLLTPVEDRPWTYRDRDGAMRVTPYPVQGFRTTFMGPSGLIPRLLRETRSEILVMTLPDVTVIPALRTLGEKVGDLPYKVTLPDGTDVTAMLENWVLPRGDFPAGSKVSMGVVLNKFLQHGQVESREQLSKLLQGWSFGPDDVLDTDELEAISARVEEYNQVIRQAGALDRRVHVMDAHSEFDQIAAGHELVGEGPPVVLGAHFTGARDATGREGVFSYDGVHLSYTGHAVLANRVQATIARELGWEPRFKAFVEAAPIDEKAVLRSDPHHLQGEGELSGAGLASTGAGGAGWTGA